MRSSDLLVVVASIMAIMLIIIITMFGLDTILAEIGWFNLLALLIPVFLTVLLVFLKAI